MRTFLLSFLLLTAVLQKVQAQTQTNLYVDSSMTASSAGTSWATAYKTLKEALNLANNGSTTISYNIHIAKGTYYPTGAQSGTSRDSAFVVMRNGIKIYGGYPTGGGVRNVTSYPTVLSGDVGTVGNNTDNSYHVVVMLNITTAGDSTFLDGLTLASGNANGTGSMSYGGVTVSRAKGGGIWMSQSADKALIRNCTLRNHWGDSGGGLYIETSSSVFNNVRFIDNQANLGGALATFSTPSSSLMQMYQGCVFNGNRAVSEGGAGYIYANSYCTFADCLFTDNATTGTGTTLGGAIRTNEYINTLRCTFSQSKASTGGALYLTAGGKIDTCNFTANKALMGDGGAICYNQSSQSRYGFIFACVGSVFHANTALMGNGGAVADGIDRYWNSSYDSCTFTNDSAKRGGAIYNSTDLTLFRCELKNNYVSDKGGAIYTFQTELGIYRCKLSGNRADSSGGALYADSTDNGSLPYLTLRNVLFSGNLAGQQGGAIFAHHTGNMLYMHYCTFAGDSAQVGNGLYCTYSIPHFINCIIWEGLYNGLYSDYYSPDLYYSLIQDFAYTGGVAPDPLFVNPQPASAAPTVAGDYNITACSPAINIGIDNTNGSDTLDVIGNARISGNISDIGAYEFQSESLTGVLSGPLSVCEDATASYTSTIAGGTWSNAQFLQGAISSSGMYTANLRGIDTIRYTVMSGSCPVSSELQIYVKPLPPVASISLNANSHLCQGTTFTATASKSGVWGVADTNRIGLDLNNSSGTYGVFQTKIAGTTPIFHTVTGTNGCKATNDIPVTVQPPPAVDDIVGDNTLCISNIIQLYNNTSGGTWSKTSNSSGFNISSTGLVRGVVAGTGYATYTIIDIYGCLGIDSQYIAVGAKPSNTVTQSGSTLTAAQTGASYDWFECVGTSKNSVGATGRNFTPTRNGQYGVSVTNNFCTVESSCYPVTVTAVSNVSTENWNLYPNPTSGSATLQTGSIIAKNILVHDITGKLLIGMKPTSAETVLDVKGFAPGLYLVTVVDEEGSTAILRLTVAP